MAAEVAHVQFNLELVGRRTAAERFEVTADSIAAYSAATGHQDARLLDGQIAPLLYGVVPSWHLSSTATRRVAADEHFSRVVHGEHWIHSPRPLRAEETVTSHAAVRSVRPVSKGTIVQTEILTFDDAGHLVVQQLSTSFFVGVRAAEGTGAVAERTGSGLPEGPTRTWRVETGPELPRRYAEASGDRSAIHLESSAARELGFEGVILHGMCSLALASRAVVGAEAGGDPTRLRSIACRFADVAYPGRALDVSMGTASDGSLGFAVHDEGGRQVMTRGRATLGDPQQL